MPLFPQQWEPPEDPATTPCPYVSGFRVTIEAHTPPPPFGHRDYQHNNDVRPHDIPEEERKTMTKTQLVLADPPMETSRPEGPHKTAELVISEPVATGHDRGSQVAFVLVTPSEWACGPSFVATAKIFDPMYYPFQMKEFPGHPQHVSYKADREYSREASALSYATQLGLAGGFVPKYYGSWTFNLGVPGSQTTRPVRLVLYEQIRGTSLYSLYRRYREGSEEHFDVLYLPEKYRLEVFALLLDGQVRLLHNGLQQKDLAPRNVIVSPAPAADDPEPVVKRVTLVDYANSIVYPLSRHRQHPHQKRALPMNPIRYFLCGAGMEFDGWVPDDFPRYVKWLQETFGSEDRAAMYAPETERPDSPSGSPSGTPRPAAPSNAQAGQERRSTPVQPGQAKSGIEREKHFAAPPTLPNPLPEGFRLWAPVKFLNVSSTAEKP